MNDVEQLVAAAGFDDFRWIDGSEVVVAHWVRMKCIYACDGYAHQAFCPPNAPAVEACAEFFAEYGRIAVVHIQKAGDSPDALQAWKKDIQARLLELERAVFLAGYHKALTLTPGILFPVPGLCPSTRGLPAPGIEPADSRGVGDRRLRHGPQDGLPDRGAYRPSQMMDRYAFLLVE